MLVPSTNRNTTTWQNTRKKIIVTIIRIIFTILVFCQVVVFLFVDGTSIPYTKELFFNVLRVSLFLSPSLILLIPVMAFIAEIASWAYHTDLFFKSYVKTLEGMTNEEDDILSYKKHSLSIDNECFFTTCIKKAEQKLRLDCF